MAELKIPDINTIQIAGTLTGDPVFRQTPNGSSVATFTMEANRKYRDNAGILRENTCHVNVSAWHKLADLCQELQKDHSVLVDGELQNQPQSGEDGLTGRSIVEIRARRIQALNIKADQGGDALPAKKVETATKPNEEKTKTVQVPTTPFDFGYQNFKI
jgi:single-strand DNA-binding protein